MIVEEQIRLLAVLPLEALDVALQVRDDLPSRVTRFFSASLKRPTPDQNTVGVTITDDVVMIRFKGIESQLALPRCGAQRTLEKWRVLVQLYEMREGARDWNHDFDLQASVPANQVDPTSGQYVAQGNPEYLGTVPTARIFGKLTGSDFPREADRLLLPISFELQPKDLDFNELLFARLVIPSPFPGSGKTVYGAHHRRIRVCLPPVGVVGEGQCDASPNRQGAYFMMDGPRDHGKEFNYPWIELDCDRMRRWSRCRSDARDLGLEIHTDEGVVIEAASFDLEFFGGADFRVAR